MLHSGCQHRSTQKKTGAGRAAARAGRAATVPWSRTGGTGCNCAPPGAGRAGRAATVPPSVPYPAMQLCSKTTLSRPAPNSHIIYPATVLYLNFRLSNFRAPNPRPTRAQPMRCSRGRRSTVGGRRSTVGGRRFDGRRSTVAGRRSPVSFKGTPGPF